MRESVWLRCEDGNVIGGSRTKGGLVVIILSVLHVFVGTAEYTIALTFALIVFILTTAIGTIRFWRSSKTR